MKTALSIGKKNIFAFFLFYLLFICLDNAQAQEYSIGGTIVDSISNPIKGVLITVNALGKENFSLKSESNNEGKFTFLKLKSGRYIVEIKGLNYNEFIASAEVKDANLTLNDIVLTHKVYTLKEVVVEGKPPLIEQKVDRTVYNVENNVSLSGSNALDAIGKIPGMKVNGGDNISLAGRGQVNVLVNGRQVYMSGQDLSNYLKSMSSSDISRIELMQTPPANYDAGSGAGLINIITKKRKKSGFNSSVFANLMHAYYGSSNIGGNFNYNEGKWYVSANINLTNNNYNELTNPITVYPEQTWNQQRKSKNNTKSLLNTISVDYQINKRQTMTLTNTFYKRAILADEVSETTILNNINHRLDSLTRTTNLINKNAFSNNCAIHYEISMDSAGSKISFDGGLFNFDSNVRQYSNAKNYLPNNLLNSSYELNSDAPLKIKAYTMQTDYNFSVRKINLSLGGKMSFIKNETSALYFSPNGLNKFPDSNLSNTFNYNENVQALYVNANKNFGLWEAQVGLRAENTQTTGYSITYNQSNINNYFKLFPTLFLTKKFNKVNTLTFSYSKRVNRPSYWYLNPFKQYVSPFFYYEGNPFLQPSFNSNFRVMYDYKEKLVSQIFFDILNNVFDQITIPNVDTKISKLTRLNYYNQKNIGLTESYTYNKLKFLESYNSFSVFFSKTNSYTNYADGTQGWGGEFSSNNTFILNSKKTLLASLDFNYSSPQISGISKFQSYYSLGIGLKALFLQKKLMVALNGNDIFRTSKIRFSSVTNGVITSYTNYFDNQFVRLTANYSFGKLIKNRKAIKSSDESRRAN